MICAGGGKFRVRTAPNSRTPSVYKLLRCLTPMEPSPTTTAFKAEIFKG